MRIRLILLFLFAFQLCTNGQAFSTSTIEVKPLPKLPQRIKAIDDFISGHSISRSLNSEVIEWYYWTNYSRNNPRSFWDSVVVPFLKVYPNLNTSYAQSLKRDLYKSSSLPYISPNQALLKTAKDHAQQMAKDKATPSHTSPNGNTFEVRMNKAGIQKCAGENISYGPSNPVVALIFLYIDERIPDLGHRKTLLNPTYTEMGVGISIYPNGNLFVVQDFACQQI